MYHSTKNAGMLKLNTLLSIVTKYNCLTILSVESYNFEPTMMVKVSQLESFYKKGELNFTKHSEKTKVPF